MHKYKTEGIISMFIVVSILFSMNIWADVNSTESNRIYPSDEHTIYVKEDGTVWEFGKRDYRADKGYSFWSETPVQVEELTDVLSVRRGSDFLIAIKKDGTVWTWGNSVFGQTGDKPTITSQKPIQVVGLSDIISISAPSPYIGMGNYVIALKKDGTVWKWGHNGYFGGKDTLNQYRSTPVKVEGLTDIVEVETIGSGTTLALKKDGTVWIFGGFVTGKDELSYIGMSPHQIQGITDASTISYILGIPTVIMEDGSVRILKSNQGKIKSISISGLSNVASIQGGVLNLPRFRGTIAQMKDGTLWEIRADFDKYNYGALNGEDLSDVLSIGNKLTALNNVDEIVYGDFNVFFIKSDGTVWAWGKYDMNLLGVGKDVEFNFGSIIPVRTLITVRPRSITQSYSKQNNLLAAPTSSNVIIDGKKIAFESYNIDGNNYFKLRDLAMALNVSNKQFEITWDNTNNAINILTNSSYSTIGDELSLPGNTDSKIASFSSSDIYLNGIQILLAAYNINGNNYFKLRDIGSAINFEVSWDSSTDTINLDTSKDYSE